MAVLYKRHSNYAGSSACYLDASPGDDNYPVRWQSIKSCFVRKLVQAQILKIGKGFRLWQPRYWEHTIRNDKDFERHMNYIHYNPVKHGVVERVKDWPYSSFYRYVRLGWFDLDWAGVPENIEQINFGE